MAREETYNTIDCKESLLFTKKGNYGGYKQELVKKDLTQMQIDYYVCSRCNGVMRNACLMNGSDQFQACLQCLSKEEGSSILIEKITDNIARLSAKCPLGSRGCVWNGNLGEIERHLDECTEFMMSCSNICGVILKKSELQNHYENACQLRKTTCEYCGVTMQYKMLVNHHEMCLEFPSPCPNECLKRLNRKEIYLHIEKECPKDKVIYVLK